MSFSAVVESVLSEINLTAGRAWISPHGKVIWTNGMQHGEHMFHHPELYRGGSMMNDLIDRMLASGDENYLETADTMTDMGWVHITPDGMGATFDVGVYHFTRQTKDGLWDWAKAMHDRGLPLNTSIEIYYEYSPYSSSGTRVTLDDLLSGNFR